MVIQQFDVVGNYFKSQGISMAPHGIEEKIYVFYYFLKRKKLYSIICNFLPTGRWDPAMIGDHCLTSFFLW